MNHKTKNWNDYLDSKMRTVLDNLDVWSLPDDTNIICEALKNHKQTIVNMMDTGTTITTLSKLATLNQMVIFDATDGPENDGEPKALRRHWYQWYKVNFAQPLSDIIGEDMNHTDWGTRWAGRLSQTYAFFVDNHDITYLDLWVEDASRMMKQNWITLFNNCHIIIAVEKDSLFGDFEKAAKAVGTKSLYSGKGKSSKAAIEKLLREHYRWNGEWETFTEENPLYVIHISDWDYDGETVIGPTFAEQCRRYTPYIKEARVGINPEQVDNKIDKWYQIKVSNKAYQKWADTKALGTATCDNCNTSFVVNNLADSIRTCPECNMESSLIVYNDLFYGFEVEAMKSRDYYSLIVHAVVELIGFDYIIEKLRDECVADAYGAADSVLQKILDENSDYQRLLEEFDRLEQIKNEFESDTKDHIFDLARPHIKDWRHIEDDPEVEQFVKHVETASNYTEAWRPFSSMLRTERLINYVQNTYSDEIDNLKNQEIEW